MDCPMAHLDIILRQVRRSSRQAILFTLCVALSLMTLAAFSGFAASVHGVVVHIIKQTEALAASFCPTRA